MKHLTYCMTHTAPTLPDQLARCKGKFIKVDRGAGTGPLETGCLSPPHQPLPVGRGGGAARLQGDRGSDGHAFKLRQREFDLPGMRLGSSSGSALDRADQLHGTPDTRLPIPLSRRPPYARAPRTIFRQNQTPCTVGHLHSPTLYV